MALYHNTRQSSVFAGVEFSPSGSGNLCYLHLAPGADPAVATRWLSSQGQQIIAQTTLQGHGVIISSGPQSQDGILSALAKNGEQMVQPPPEKKFNPWAMRGMMSIIGQSLTLYSATRIVGHTRGGTFIPITGGIDSARATYAISNLLANATNIAFGAEKKQDVHRLHYLKQEFNQRLSQYLPEGVAPPNPSDNQSSKRHDDQAAGDDKGVKGFVSRNSVRFGEIGLRLFGTFGLLFPAKRWKPTLEIMSKQGFLAGAKHGINPDKMTLAVGLTYLVGKTISFFPKAPDPFDPKPHTWWDTIREKYLFKLSTVIEAGADSIMFYDCFRNRQVNIGGKQMRDYPGALGSAVFIGAYGFRWFAPYGKKNVNMKELDAHITDGLAKVPQEKRPQLLADTAASLVDHFKDEKLEFGQVYKQLADDLYRYHHIAVGVSPDGVGSSRALSANLSYHPAMQGAAPGTSVSRPVSFAQLTQGADMQAPVKA